MAGKNKKVMCSFAYKMIPDENRDNMKCSVHNRFQATDLTCRQSILFLNQYYPPDRSATAGVLERIVENLSSHYNITVIAGRPSYLSTIRHSWKPVYFSGTEKIRIINVGSLAYPRKNLLFRSLNYLSYIFISSIVAFFTKADLIVAMTDPPISGLIGAIIAKLKQKPSIYFIQDLHPDMAIASGMIRTGMVTQMWHKIHKWVFTVVDKIIVIGHDMAEKVIGKGVDSNKICTIRHGAAKQQLGVAKNQSCIETLRSGHPFVFVHAGNIGQYGAWECLIDAVTLINQGNIGLIFIGEGQNKERLVELSREKHNVHFFPFQPRHNVNSILEAGDVHIITIKNGIEGLVVPSKIYPILSAGKPILAVCPETSDTARIVRQFNCGIVVNPDSSKEISEAMKYFYNNRDILNVYSENSRKAAEYYNQEGQINILKNEIESVINKKYAHQQVVSLLC